MSLLGTPVYANPTTPLWVSSAGGTISGDLTVGPPGFITGGRIAASKAINPTFGNFALSDASGITQGGLNQITGVGVTDVNLQCTSGRSTFFGLVGSTNANSYITPSVFGANTDLLRINGTTRTNVMDSPDSGGNRAIRITGGAPGIGYIQGSTIRFTELDQTTGNSALVTSTAGTNADLLTIGGTVDAQALKLANGGSAPTVGSDTLAGGQKTITTTAADVTSYILVSRTNLAGVPPQDTGFLRVSNKSANSFTVVSVDSSGNQLVTDDSSFDWILINPA